MSRDHGEEQVHARIARLPDALRRALDEARAGRLPLCEEVLLAVWMKAPSLFGAGAAELLAELAPGAERALLAARVQRALGAARDACPSEAPGASPSPRIVRALLADRFDPERPATLLAALAEAPSSLLCRLLRPGSAAERGRPTRGAAPMLVVVSGASGGASAALLPGAPVGVGRDPGAGELGPRALAIRDQTIPRWRDGAAPLRVTWVDGAVRLSVARGSLRIAPGPLDAAADRAADPGAPLISGPGELDVPVGPEGLVFAYGSTELAVVLRAGDVARIERRTTGAAGGRAGTRILLIASNPVNVPHLRLLKEVKEIRDNLGSGYELVEELAARRDELQKYLLRHRPDMVHFAGHGDRHGELILEDEAGRAASIKLDALAELFGIISHKHRIRCVVLNACYSMAQAQAMARHVDYVIGMNRPISDTAAIEFAKAFYRALEYDDCIRTAFDLGRCQINMSGQGEQDTPQLFPSEPWSPA